MTKPIYTPDQFIPAEIEQQLIQAGDSHSASSWAIARTVQEILTLYDRAVQAGADLRFGRMEIYTYAARKVGKGVRRIRDYASVAAFYPPAVQDEFSILYFDHFQTAMRYGPRWRELLAACLEQIGYSGGGIPSVDWMEAYASTEIITALEVDELGAMPPQPQPPDDPSQYYNLTTESPDAVHLSPAAIRSAIHHIQDHQQAIYRIVNTIPNVPESVLADFLAASDQLQAVIREIAQLLAVDTDPEKC